jgi:hypothetical protein
VTRRRHHVPDRVKIQTLENRVKDLESTIARKDRELRVAKNQAALVAQIAGPYNAHAVATIQRWLDRLHTLSQLADPTRATGLEPTGRSGPGEGPAHNPRAAWAARRLDLELDHVADLTEALDTFLHSPRPVPQPRTRAATRWRCADCGLPHCREAS